MTTEELIRTACHTAVSELGDETYYEDLVDCVHGQLGELKTAHLPFVLERLYQLGVSIPEWEERSRTLETL